MGFDDDMDSGTERPGRWEPLAVKSNSGRLRTAPESQSFRVQSLRVGSRIGTIQFCPAWCFGAKIRRRGMQQAKRNPLVSCSLHARFALAARAPEGSEFKVRSAKFAVLLPV